MVKYILLFLFVYLGLQALSLGWRCLKKRQLAKEQRIREALTSILKIFPPTKEPHVASADRAVCMIRDGRYGSEHIPALVEAIMEYLEKEFGFKKHGLDRAALTQVMRSAAYDRLARVRLRDLHAELSRLEWQPCDRRDSPDKYRDRSIIDEAARLRSEIDDLFATVSIMEVEFCSIGTSEYDVLKLAHQVRVRAIEALLNRLKAEPDDGIRISRDIESYYAWRRDARMRWGVLDQDIKRLAEILDEARRRVALSTAERLLAYTTAELGLYADLKAFEEAIRVLGQDSTSFGVTPEQLKQLETMLAFQDACYGLSSLRKGFPGRWVNVCEYALHRAFGLDTEPSVSKTTTSFERYSAKRSYLAITSVLKGGSVTIEDLKLPSWELAFYHWRFSQEALEV